jgi:hypothetical protein
LPLRIVTLVESLKYTVAPVIVILDGVKYPIEVVIPVNVVTILGIAVKDGVKIILATPLLSEALPYRGRMYGAPFIVFTVSDDIVALGAIILVAFNKFVERNPKLKVLFTVNVFITVIGYNSPLILEVNNDCVEILLLTILFADILFTLRLLIFIVNA